MAGALRYEPQVWFPDRHVATDWPAQRLLNAGLLGGSSFLVTGGRGLGKRATLLLLEDQLVQGRRGVVVCMDIQGVGGGRTVQPSDVFLPLARRLHHQAKLFLQQEGHYFDLPVPPTTHSINAFDTLLLYAYELHERISDVYGAYSQYLLLYNAGRLGGEENTSIILGNLRALCQDRLAGRPQLVISGFRDLRDFRAADGLSPLRNLCTPHSLELFPEHAAGELMTPLLDRLEPELRTPYRRWLTEMAGGHPLVMQCLCAAAERSLDGGRRPGGAPQVGSEQRTLLVDRSFNKLYGAWDAQDRAAMDDLVQHGALNTSKISDESRAVLCYSGVAIEQDGEIRAPVGLFNAWYREERGARPRVFWFRDGVLTLEDGKRGIVQTCVGETVGTAFFVDDRYLLTCEHNLYPDAERLRPRAERVDLRFTVGEASGETRVACLVQVHPHGHDLALLRLELGPDEQAPVGLRHLMLNADAPSEGSAVTTWGYPVLVEALTDQGSKVDGILLDPDTTLKGKPALELRASQQDSPAWGLSGAPIWTEQGVIGVVSHQLLRERAPDWDGRSRPCSLDGRFFAVSIQVAVEGFMLRGR